MKNLVKRIFNSEWNNNYNLINAKTDIEAINVWLNEYNGYTRLYYRNIVQRFYAFLKVKKNKSFQELKLEDIQAYKLFLANPDADWCGNAVPRDNPKWKPFIKGLNPTSIEIHFRALRSMFSYLFHSGYLQYNFAILIKYKAKQHNVQNKYLSMEEYKLVYSKVIQLFGDNSVRYTFLLDLMFYTGLRRSEIANARQSDIFVKRGQWWIKVIGKGNKCGEVPIPPILINELQKYRQYWGLNTLPNYKESNIPLIIKSNTINYNFYSDAGIHAVIKRIARLVINDLPYLSEKLCLISSHWMRHSYATALCDSGIELQIVKENMRHSNIETTMRYIHINNDIRHRETSKFGSLCA